MVLKKYRNELLSAVQRCGLDPLLFEIADGDTSDKSGFEVRLRNTELRFLLREDDTNPHAFKFRHTCLGRGFPLTGWLPTNFYENIIGVLEIFDKWLRLHVAAYLEDLDTRDMWREMAGAGVGGFAAFDSTGNQPFGEAETCRLADAMTQFLEKVRERELLNETQHEMLASMVRGAISSSQRLGRKDWINATVGAFMGFAVSALLAPDALRTVVALFKDAIAWATGSPPLLP